MDSAQSLLSLSNLTLIRDSMAVVTDGHLAVNKGEIVCLVGPNGSGKTSLAELLAGISPCAVSSGSIMFFGKDLLALTLADRARSGLYVAFQQVPEFDGVTAETFLYEAYVACSGLRPKHADFKSMLIELCCVVGLQITHLNRPLFKGFSGGERKRFQLLELLLLRPQLAVLDELDAGLDAEGLQLFFKIIKKLRAKDSGHKNFSHEKLSAPKDAMNNYQGCAFLIITHNQTVIDTLVQDRVYEFFDHRLRELSTRELLEKRIEGSAL
jgi:Fe-S cluster assembly ATP-binding protein